MYWCKYSNSTLNSLQIGKIYMKVIKGSVRSSRTALLDQAKGPCSPRLHSQQQQAAHAGGKVRRARRCAVWSFPNPPQLPPKDKLPTDLLTCPEVVVPRTNSSALKGCPSLLRSLAPTNNSICTLFWTHTYPPQLSEGRFPPHITAKQQEQTLPKTIW